MPLRILQAALELALEVWEVWESKASVPPYLRHVLEHIHKSWSSTNKRIWLCKTMCISLLKKKERIWGFWSKFMSDTVVLASNDRVDGDVKNIHSQSLCRVTWHIFRGHFGKVYAKKYNAHSLWSRKPIFKTPFNKNV